MHTSLPRDAGRGPSHRALAAIAGLLFALLLPAVAVAHAELVSSTPAAGAVLTEVPAEIILTFDEDVVGNSSFQVLNAAGTTVAEGAPDAAAPTTMRADLPTLAPGEYLVQWTSVAADTDVEHGTFTFTIAEPTPPPPTPTPAPTDEPTAEPTATSAPPSPTPGPSPSPTGDGGADAGASDVVLPIVVVAVLVVAGLAFFMRRGRA